MNYIFWLIDLYQIQDISLCICEIIAHTGHFSLFGYYNPSISHSARLANFYMHVLHAFFFLITYLTSAYFRYQGQSITDARDKLISAYVNTGIPNLEILPNPPLCCGVGIFNVLPS